MVNDFDFSWDLELLGRQLSILPGAATLQDIESRFITANMFSMKFMGFSSFHEMHNKLPGDIKSKFAEMHDDLVKNAQFVISQRIKVTSIISAYDSNDNWGMYLTQHQPLWDKNQNVVGMASATLDITKTSLVHTLAPLFLNINNKHSLKLRQGLYHYADVYDAWHFSKRQAECLFWLLHRKTAVEIGHILGLTKRTVESYIRIIKEKFQVNTATQLIELAKQNGLDQFIPKHWIIAGQTSE